MLCGQALQKSFEQLSDEDKQKQIKKVSLDLHLSHSLAPSGTDNSWYDARRPMVFFN